MTDAHEHNRRAWDQRVRENRRFTRPVDPKELDDPLKSIDPWVAAEVPSDKRVLCLAAGGGRQGILCANTGAEVTVVDISQAMLDIDDRVAADRGLPVRTVRTSMDEGLALVGDAVGTLIIAVDRPDGTGRIGLFGPVITELPDVEASLRLWDGFLAMVATDGFFELKRTRSSAPARLTHADLNG